MMKKKNLSGILKETAGISEENLREAEKLKLEKGVRLSEALLQKKIVSESQLLEAYSMQYHIPFWPYIPINNFAGEFTQKVPIQFLKKYAMAPLECSGDDPLFDSFKMPTDERFSEEDFYEPGCVIVINDPTSFQALDDLAQILELKHYRIALSTKDAILSYINMSYDFSRDSAEQLVQNMEENDEFVFTNLEETADLLDDASDAPIIRLLNHVITQSIKARASDIHVEPVQKSFKIRYRVDGILYDLLAPPKWILPALISRIKVMSNLNIAEKRLPQDGRFEVKIGTQNIDVRVSIIPTTFGERAVLRLLNKSNILLSLSDLGLVEDRLSLLKELIETPNGIILVTGPTGSGKTTTLYAVLSAINTAKINIITIEDPVEYQLDGISQIQVNPKIDLTFASGLRSVVRQDPDVLLIGEIRDRETADIAVQSALTGHLVFATLHTNDSASAITRLVDIGVEPFLISSAVTAVMAQRLVRVLCTECKEPFTPDEFTLNRLGVDTDRVQELSICQAKGCEHCFKTGYRGRIGIFEILVFHSELKSLILKTFDSNQIKNEAQKHMMVTLQQDGIQKILKGITTIEEVLRVTES
jgi:general secretion pathway protein E